MTKLFFVSVAQFQKGLNLKSYSTAYRYFKKVKAICEAQGIPQFSTSTVPVKAVCEIYQIDRDEFEHNILGGER